MNPRLVRPASLALALGLATLALPSCGGGNPQEAGKIALQKGDWEEAQEKLGEALAKMQPSAPDYLETKLGELRARAHLDAPAAQSDFMTLAKGSSLGVENYRMMVDEFTTAGAFPEAIDLLKAGKEAHPDYPKWQDLIQRVGKQAEKAGDQGALDALKGLGYIGEG